jgi:uncharacterized protein YggE
MMEKHFWDKSKLRTIVVTGIGQASAQPNRAMLGLGVSTMATTASDALNTNSTSMNRVMDAIKQTGIKETDLETSRFTLHPRYTHPRSGEPEDMQLVGFEVVHMVRVLTERNEVSKVLDAAVDAGANRIINVSFAFQKERLQELHREARQNAVSDAREKADVIATSLGVNIVGVANAIEDAHPSPPQRPYHEGMALRARVAAPISPPSEAAVQISLRVTYIIE